MLCLETLHQTLMFLFSIYTCHLGIFETLLILTDCLHLNTKNMILSLLWFLCINCLFILIDCMTCSTVIPFSTISNISIPVNSVNSITVFFKHAWYTNPGAKRKETGSNS